jgi:hypothetical protein
MGTYINQDGLEVRFGSSIGDRGNKAAVTTGAGKRRELVLLLTLTGAARTLFTADLNNDATNEAFNPSNTPLPIGAIINDVSVVTVETPAGGTNYAVGTYKEDGTVVDADGILTTAGADGAQIGTAVSAATGPWYVTAVTTGTYTAGKVKVVIEYITV